MKDKNAIFELLAPDDESGFGELYEIYLEAIDLTERKPREALRAMLSRPEYRFIVARREGRIVGFAILFVARDGALALLEYLAIDVRERGRGLGGALFTATVRWLHASHGPTPLLVEVESDPATDAEQLSQQSRRIRFYERLGCRRIEGLAYRLPLRVAGPPPRMELMRYAPSLPDALPRMTIREWLIALYRDVYDQSAEDPRIELMLAELGQRGEDRS